MEDGKLEGPSNDYNMEGKIYEVRDYKAG